MVWSTLETRHWRLWISLVFLLPLGYGLALALGASADFANSLSTASRMPFLYDKPVGEDGFYMLGVAWNLAEGRGLVGNFDQPVTGVQPLATLIYAALAWLMQSVGGGRDEFIRLVIAFGVANLAVFAHLMGRLAARYADDAVSGRALYSLAIVLVCTSFYLFRVFTYGLETGIYLTVLILVLRHYFALSDAVNESNRLPLRSSVHFGFWVGVAGLARIDFGVLYFFFLLRCYHQNKPLLPALILAGAIASVIVAPWFLHVYQVSGTILPSSGPAQAGFISWDQLDG